ncbi:hypothetical protein MAR_004944, partial [Mya arenaria]
MFCCRGPPCLDEAEPSRKEKRKQEKLLPDDKKSHATLHDSIYIHQPNNMHARSGERPDSTRIQNMLHANQRFMDPRVKHVTNVHNDMHVKLAGFQQRVTGYVEGSYRIVKVPLYTRKPSQPQHAKTHGELARTSTPAWTVIGKNEINFAHENDSDTESFSTKQMAAIAQLDYTIDKYKTDSDDESVSPTIVADVLPPGVYESFDEEKELRPSDSDQPPSRSSSVSDKSGSSRSGIISNRMSTGSEKRKNNSVSFQLPEEHVDKPYAPMQTSRKHKSTTHAQLEMTPNISPPSTLIIKTGNVKLAHAGN